MVAVSVQVSSEVLVTKRLLAALAVLVLALSAVAVAGCGGDIPNDAVAKVGDTVIAQDVFDGRLSEFAAQYSIPSKEEDPEGWALFEKDVLEYLITYEIVVQKAEEYGLAVTDEEIQTELDTIIADYYGGDEAKFLEDLEAYDMTLDTLKANYRESMLMQKVYEKVISEVTTVPEEDIAAYYEENKDYYSVDETRTTRHILIAPGGPATNPTDSSTTSTTTGEPTEADWSRALAIAEEVRAKLAGGGDWAELAKLYSDDSGTAASGGDLGEVYKGQMVPEFEEAVFSLEIDEISEPIKTTYGYHIIQVTAVNEAKQYSLEEVRDDITSTLLSELQGEAWQKWIEDTKSEIGVTYKEGYEPTTTTSTTAPNATDTTAAGATDTTAAGETIGTEATTE